MIIHKHGYWIGKAEHKYDKRLAKAIIRFAKKNNVHTVADIGCGDGSYTDAFNKAGISCAGYDGNPMSPGKTVDLAWPVDMGVHDMVVSLEVGEHIPRHFESVFINNIIDSTRRFIILSWAVEGQGGVGHINCRNNDFIIDKLTNKGFTYKRKSSIILRYCARLEWFKKTIMVYEIRNTENAIHWGDLRSVPRWSCSLSGSL